MSVEAYPLHWPRGYPRTPPDKRQPARFGKRSANGGLQDLSIAEARKRLLREISAFTAYGQPWRINPDEVVISSNVPVRRDGLPRSTAREPGDPGVAIYFHLDGEPYCFPCDAWTRAADNIAAVAAHLGAMRGIERWGVGDLRTAFTGWRALPDPEQAGGRSWYDVLGVGPHASRFEIRAAYHRRRRETHPDTGGDAAEFHAVQKAWQEAQAHAQQENGRG